MATTSAHFSAMMPVSTGVAAWLKGAWVERTAIVLNDQPRGY